MNKEYETYTINCGPETSAGILLPIERRLVYVTRHELDRCSLLGLRHRITFLAWRDGCIWRSHLTCRDILPDDLWRYAAQEKEEDEN